MAHIYLQTGHRAATNLYLLGYVTLTMLYFDHIDFSKYVKQKKHLNLSYNLYRVTMTTIQYNKTVLDRNLFVALKSSLFKSHRRNLSSQTVKILNPSYQVAVIQLTC